jgi:hypothetical protein
VWWIEANKIASHFLFLFEIFLTQSVRLEEREWEGKSEKEKEKNTRTGIQSSFLLTILFNLCIIVADQHTDAHKPTQWLQADERCRRLPPSTEPTFFPSPSFVRLIHAWEVVGVGISR